MPRLSGYRSTPPVLAERMLEQLDVGLRHAIRARGNRTNVNRRVFGCYSSSAKGLCPNSEWHGWNCALGLTRFGSSDRDGYRRLSKRNAKTTGRRGAPNLPPRGPIGQTG